jgi:signal peptidase II
VLILALTAVAVLALDLLTKAVAARFLVLGHPVSVIDGILRLTLVHNTGAAFGLFPGSRLAFIGFSAAAMVVIVILYFRLPDRNAWQLVALGGLVGGAVGNLHDRVLHGWVIDFIEIGVGRYHWPVFNVADMAVTGGVALLLWGVARRAP